MTETIQTLYEQARRCRRLAKDVATPDVACTLEEMAVEYEARAGALEARAGAKKAPGR